jgi:hypothetical protein
LAETFPYPVRLGAQLPPGFSHQRSIADRTKTGITGVIKHLVPNDIRSKHVNFIGRKKSDPLVSDSNPRNGLARLHRSSKPYVITVSTSKY